MEPKKWWESNTIRVALAAILGQLVLLLQGGIAWAEFQGALGTFGVAVLMIVFRVITKQPIE